VGQDNGCGIMVKRTFYHHTWVYDGAIDAAMEEFLKSDNPMPIVEKEAGENLVVKAPQASD